MKIKLLYCLGIFAIVISATMIFAYGSDGRINWKKVTTEDEARAVMDKKILPQSNFDTDLSILSKEKRDFFEGDGDTIIYYNSPEIPVHFLSLVARKFMFKFHFKDKV